MNTPSTTAATDSTPRTLDAMPQLESIRPAGSDPAGSAGPSLGSAASSSAAGSVCSPSDMGRSLHPKRDGRMAG